MSKPAKKPRAAPKKAAGAAKAKKAEKTEPTAEAETQPKARERKKVQRPKGATPTPSVSSRRAGDTVVRRAKGYSLGELEGASLPLRLAAGWNLPIDIRRRSVVDGNVESLKAWLTHAGATARKKEESS